MRHYFQRRDGEKTTTLSRALLALAAGVLPWIAAAPSAGAQEISVVKLGMTYEIGFPENLEDPVNPALGVAAGVNTYRIVSHGGDTWYKVQRVYRHPRGGWFTPPGVKQTWVNMGYAYVVREALK